jgi:Lar family restriction alleviation protein
MKIKPCPFCGKTPIIKEHSGDYGYHTPSVSISCAKCGIHFSERTEKWVQFKGHIKVKDAKEKVIKRWNTRKG